MPVPASYNDITQDIEVRDHIGDVWYEQTFFVPAAWRDRRVVLRVGSASHHAQAWINGRLVTQHKGGFLPFEGDASEALVFGAENRITLRVNNVLDWTTLPPGQVISPTDPMHPKGFKHQEYYHDFFNYAGIHRPVKLVALPRACIEDIRITPDVRGTDGIVNYQVRAPKAGHTVRVKVLDEQHRTVAEAEGHTGRITVRKARLWHPMNAYLYTLRVELCSRAGIVQDVYAEPFGIRTVAVRGKRLLINGKPFYFRGMCKHEDADLRGKGLDPVTNVKDLNIFKWMGANSFRTSHYPYSEEMMDLCDRYGIVVIDEVPAVGFNRWNKGFKLFCPERINNETLQHHCDCISELVHRDKNHPCVVLWSVANEAATYEEGSAPYFKKVIAHARTCDPSRPITIVESTPWNESRVAQWVDVIGVNRYYSWYSDSGRLDVIRHQVTEDFRQWYRKFRKPLIVTEFGADTVAGLHMWPPEMFSEEFQQEFLREFCEAFDQVDAIIGEHVWNFADFGTKQEVRRVVGNRKGVFTRQRQPKASAFYLRDRWLAQPAYGVPKARTAR
jgi:beta-glucuronidase